MRARVVRVVGDEPFGDAAGGGEVALGEERLGVGVEGVLREEEQQQREHGRLSVDRASCRSSRRGTCARPA